MSDIKGGGEMTPQEVLRLSEKLHRAMVLLVIHGIISDGERTKAGRRLDQWAAKHGLRRTTR